MVEFALLMVFIALLVILAFSLLGFSVRGVMATVVDEGAFYASVDPESWARSVIVDEYNDLRRKVARELKKGDAAAAKLQVEAFRDKTAQMNARIQSPAVAAQLEELEELETDVDDQLSGKRNLSPGELKQMQSLGYSVGRSGARK